MEKSRQKVTPIFQAGVACSPFPEIRADFIDRGIESRPLFHSAKNSPGAEFFG
jgi:hypothetical protein